MSTDPSPLRYVLDWEQAVLDQLVADVFGFHAVQLGGRGLDALRANRIRDRWRLSEGAEDADLAAEWHALPFPPDSIDLAVLPHTLEWSLDAHATVREVERVIRPGGRVVITGFNPVSLWGLARRMRTWEALPIQPSPDSRVEEWVAHWRLRDWLRLLNFEVEVVRFGCFAPHARRASWLQGQSWMERVGDRWWPVFGSVYALVAVKRVHSVRLLGLSRRSPRAAAARATALSREGMRRTGSGQSPE